MFPLLGILIPLATLAKWLCMILCAVAFLGLYFAEKYHRELAALVLVIVALVSGFVGVTLWITEAMR
jgi:hypothetical protein